VQGGSRSIQAKPTPTKHRYGIPAGRQQTAGGSKRVLVLMLLIQLCLRWLMPAPSGIESSVAPVSTAPVAIENMASQHHIGLAPIHAPPPLLRLS
jgi:hypothetical protein